MTTEKGSIARFDRIATALSLVCVGHCIAVPVIAVSLPLAASMAEAEWVHWLLIPLSVLASGTVIVQAHDARRLGFLLPALTGMALLVFALFAESYGMGETAPVVTGGIVIAAAHLWRLINMHR